MIKLNRIIEDEIKVIGESAPTHEVWIYGGDVVRIERNPKEEKTWIWVGNTPVFAITESPEEVVEMLEEERFSL